MLAPRQEKTETVIILEIHEIHVEGQTLGDNVLWSFM